MVKRAVLLIGIIIISIKSGFGQNKVSGDTARLTLQDCINYALQHQPVLNQSIINISLAKTNNAINLSGWLPQVGVSGNLEHYFQLPTTIISTSGEQPIAEKVGVVNTFIPELSATESIFSPSLLLAASSAKLEVKAAEQAVDSTKIGIVANVSKAFYNLLLTLQQIDVLKEDTVLFGRSLRDAYHQYVGGIADETDYEQAAITLNNSKAQLRQAVVNVVPQYAVLKQLMGYKPETQFNVVYDTSQMLKDIVIDTTGQLQYERRIEYQQLMTVKELQHKFTTYNEYNFLPSLGAFYDYNYEYENNSFPNLFNTPYPNSLIGLTLDIPIFTGFSRLENIHKSKLEERLLDWSEVGLKSEIYTQYTTALANYKGNLYNMRELQDNSALANRVYKVVSLQYKQGIVPYLNVITAESELVTAEIGYLNALFQVLASKIDLEQAMGVISY